MRPVIPTTNELVTLLKARLDQYQVDGWEGRDGAEFYTALATVASAAISRAAARVGGRYILSATGATRASALVSVGWSGATTYAVGIRPGQVLCKTPWGVTYYLTEALERSASGSPGSAVVGVSAVWTGPEGNAPAALINEWALPTNADPEGQIAWTASTTDDGKTEFLAGVADGSITVLGASDATGGADGFLDLIAAGRGLPRVEGESDAALRKRIRTLPDVITPAAIIRAVNAAMEPWGVTATLYEPWVYGFAFGVGAFGVHPPSRPWHFVVSVPSIPYAAPGFAFGVGAFGVHPIGTEDEARAAVYAGLQDLVDQIKGAGIWASVRESTT